MIPFIEPWEWTVAGRQFSSWILFVLLGIVLGTAFGLWRARREGLSVWTTLDGGLVAVLSGFAVAKWFAVVAYTAPPWDLGDLVPWTGPWSSLGGFLGAGIAWPILMKTRGVPFWKHADNMMVGFSLGWAFGRVGCATWHDHIGRPTAFFGGMRFEPGWPRAGVDLGVRHELGLYEALASFAIFFGLLAVARWRRERPDGLLTGLGALAYAISRFLLDFLRADDLERAMGRASDTRLAGLTPAQYGMLALALWGIWILRRRPGASEPPIRGS